MNSSGQYPEINQDVLSHSEIHGSKPVCGSPWLIATYYVLHRLLAPRHPPFALSSLITKRTIHSLARVNSTQRIVFALKLSYLCVVFKERRMTPKIIFLVVGLTGLEPVTLRLSSACSNQLSYRPDKHEASYLQVTLTIGGAEEIRTPDL